MEHGNFLNMKSELIFKHIKNNILRYTVAFSALVHLVGVVLFPSWGIAPYPAKEKIIKIKTIVIPPDKPAQKIRPELKDTFDRVLPKKIKKPEPIMPRLRKRTPRAKSTKVVAPSPAVKEFSAPVNRPNKIFKPVKSMQQKHSTISPSAQYQTTAKINFSPAGPAKLRTKKAKGIFVASSSALTPRQASKTFSAIATLDSPTPIRLSSFISDLSPSHPVVHTRTFQQLNRDFSSGPTEAKIFTSMEASTPEFEIAARSPRGFDPRTHRTTERTNPVTRMASAFHSRPVNFKQMASIPLEFTEEVVGEDGNTNDNEVAKKFESSSEREEINAEHLGRIKLAFSTQVRTKIAQTKFYPPTARRRGFEGEPIVTFILGNTGDLLEVSIDNPSQHKLLNDAALDAVRSASPYPPIPELLKIKTLRFNLPISFILEGP
jgi:TonB family protein